VVAALCLGHAGPTLSADPKPVTIKSACFLPINHVVSSFIPPLIDRINKACNGEVEWTLLGGPEVVPGLDQFEAVKRAKKKVMKRAQITLTCPTLHGPYAPNLLVKKVSGKTLHQALFGFLRNWLIHLEIVRKSQRLVSPNDFCS